MTGQTLKPLTEYPQERQSISSKERREETALVQYNLDLLNSKKSDVDKDNEFTGVQSFNGGIALKSKTISSLSYTLLKSDVFLKADAESNNVEILLPECSNVLNQSFLIWASNRTNIISIKTSSGDVFNVAGNNTITLTDLDSFVNIVAVDSNRWLITTNSNCVLSTV